MMGEPTSADYDKTFNFGQSSDVKLSYLKHAGCGN